MESMAYIHYSSPLAGAEFSTVGKLVLQQSRPLPHKGIHNIYNVIINIRNLVGAAIKVIP